MRHLLGDGPQGLELLVLDHEALHVHPLGDVHEDAVQVAAQRVFHARGRAHGFQDAVDVVPLGVAQPALGRERTAHGEGPGEHPLHHRTVPFVHQVQEPALFADGRGRVHPQHLAAGLVHELHGQVLGEADDEQGEVLDEHVVALLGQLQVAAQVAALGAAGQAHGQLGPGEGLGQEVVGPDLQGPEHRAHVAPAAHEHHLDAGPDDHELFGQFRAGHAGHVHVHEGQVEVPGRGRGQGLVRLGVDRGLVALVAQGLGQELPEVLVVVHHQDLGQFRGFAAFHGFPPRAARLLQGSRKAPSRGNCNRRREFTAARTGANPGTGVCMPNPALRPEEETA